MIGKALHRGLEREDVIALIEAHDWLSGIASPDCDCDMGDRASITNPCEVCQARRAMDALNRVINPRPRTLQPSRLKNEAERVYYELWEKENERHSRINGGFTLIEHLLHGEPVNRNPLTRRESPPPVSQHDMTIATTVIQWLGTNCGRCFISSAEKEIEKRRAERVKFGSDGISQTPKAWQDRNENGELWRVADTIAGNFVSITTHESLHATLRRAIHNALCEVSKERPAEVKP